MSLPLLAAAPNAYILEHMPWFEPIYAERIELDGDGRAIVPDRPGWGFSFDLDAVRRHAGLNDSQCSDRGGRRDLDR